MALAIWFEQFVRDAVVADYAELTRTPILNLLNLTPDIQERCCFYLGWNAGKAQ